MRSVKYLVSILFLFFIQDGFGQEIKVLGKFLKDSVRIGEVVGYSLSARYPQHLTVLFPDSTFSLSPFEYSSKVFFPTHTVNGISFDSAIYYMSTFEIDRTQSLQLPVFIPTAKDCTQIYTTPDSIYLVELVKNPPDSVTAQNLPLKTNTLYEKVFSQFNYVLLIIVAAILAIIALIVWIFFGKRIIRYFNTRKLIKNHQSFIQNFTATLTQLQSAFSKEESERALSLWKKYLEQLEQRPYTKLTTRETMAVMKDGWAGENLKKIDSAIYGNQTTVMEPLQNLQKIAEDHFQKKLNDIKHG